MRRRDHTFLHDFNRFRLVDELRNLRLVLINRFIKRVRLDRFKHRHLHALAAVGDRSGIVCQLQRRNRCRLLADSRLDDIARAPCRIVRICGRRRLYLRRGHLTDILGKLDAGRLPETEQSAVFVNFINPEIVSGLIKENVAGIPQRRYNVKHPMIALALRRVSDISKAAVNMRTVVHRLRRDHTLGKRGGRNHGLEGGTGRIRGGKRPVEKRLALCRGKLIVIALISRQII